jgi:dimeric dUTPase (all-alpha-NTP-PPase superfamily)
MDIKDMIRVQADLQANHFNIIPWALIDEHRADFIRSMILALEDELHEALNETGWKPWASDRFINVNPYLGELVDAFHFLMNLILVVDPTGEKFERMYLEKVEVNKQRQAAGYTHDYRKDADGKALDEPYLTNGETALGDEVYGG